MDARRRALSAASLLAVFLTSLSPARAMDGPADCLAPMLDDRCELWAATYDYPAGYGSYGSDLPSDVAVAPDGARVYVTGESRTDDTGGSEDIATVAYEAETGAELWVARFHGRSDEDDRPSALAVNPDGNLVYVVGARHIPRDGEFHVWPRGGDYIVLAYEADTGSLAWTAAYDGPGGDEDIVEAVEVSPDGGRLYVTGWSRNGQGGFGYATIAYDARSGQQMWVARHEGGQAFDLGLSPDGTRLFVAGRSGLDQLTIAYDSGLDDTEDQGNGGEVLWTGRQRIRSDNVLYNALDLEVGRDGSRVFITGNATAAYDASTGEALWMLDHLSNENPQWIWALAGSADGRTLYATGQVWDVLNYETDAMTVAFDAATGTRIWSTRDPLQGGGQDLGLAPAGDRVFVTGTGCSTFAYEAATGDQLWVARAQSPALRGCGALDVSLDGRRVYSAGYSAPLVEEDNNSYDYVTVAYLA